MILRYALLSALVICFFSALHAQPVISSCEDFSIGDTLVFQECTPVAAGPGGAGQTWNFSSLSPLSVISQETMVAPSSTLWGGLFPTATITEKYSNGTYVYVRNTTDSMYLVGYIDSVNSDTILYPGPVLIQVRPVTYGNIFTAPFSNSFYSATYNFTGAGACTITADGYGTLVLPTGTYSNVLRLKITEPQNDTTIPGGVPGTEYTVSYVWFDTSSISALLKIDSTVVGTYLTVATEYLTKLTSTHVQPVSLPPLFRLYPNPANCEVTFSTSADGTLQLYNEVGQQLKTIPLREPGTTMSIADMPPGTYYVTFRAGSYVHTEKLVVE